MHGREVEEPKRRHHMWQVPTAPDTEAAAASSQHPPPAPLALPSPLPAQVAISENPLESDPPQSSCHSFLKDGREIRVGDCALFQSGNAPPFIGIIRWFATGKEDYLKICVNWLYRPADVKLAKGILPDSAPNEVFYSFHKDVITAASLLHPCKVAFLRKGVELPAGISSFICRRVYDIANKCLWWLTDQDYINERQEEVDKLLDKTRLDMHAALQSGGRSPKRLNGPASTQQLKSGSESVQNSGTSFLSQSRGKKRDRNDQSRGEQGRTDQGTELIKREHFVKSEDGDSANFKSENMIKAEIAKITEKGGLVSTDGVEKLVNLMQLDRTERKIDVSGRILVADVIAATDRFDFLGRFVQLRGLPILDDWLQEAHKGKTGDSSSPKENDKAVDDLLLALLRALDKLPVNLHALQTCNIGKSVNNLRSLKNLEIQKKARGLVDTWKKRVDAEINNNTKSVGSGQPVSWPVKPGFSDGSHGGSRRAPTTEVPAKGPVAQSSACKNPVAKLGHFDAIAKSSPVTPGSVKPAPALPSSVAVSSKDPLYKPASAGGVAEVPPVAIKEEKSSSSSQSQNNSQSCSSDHVKTMGSSWKEEARSSTAGSVNATKGAGGSSRHRRSNNGLLGTCSGVQKETNLCKSGSLNRATTLDKMPQSGLTCERTLDVPVADHGNNHRLIVRLPNPVRSPARSASGGSFEDPSVTGSRASSPGIPDRHEHSDRRMKLRSDACRSHFAADANTESWQSNDVKDGLAVAEGVRSPTGILDEEYSRTVGDTCKNTDASRTACSSSANEKSIFLSKTGTRNSFSSIHALIESCAKYSEASAPLAVGDDIGMNLLASVAAGEISKSDLVSPSGSPGASPAIEDPSTGNNESKSRLSSDEDAVQSRVQSDEAADSDSENQGKGVGSMLVKDELCQEGTNFSGSNKTTMLLQENKSSNEQAEKRPVSALSHKNSNSCTKSEGKLEDDRGGCLSASKLSELKEEVNGGESSQLEDKHMTSGQVLDNYTDGKPRSPSADESKPVKFAHEKIGEGSMCTPDIPCNKLVDGDGRDMVIATSGVNTEKLVSEESRPYSTVKEAVSTSTDQQQPLVSVVSERSGDDAFTTNADECTRVSKADNLEACKASNNEKQTPDEPIRLVVVPLGATGTIEDTQSNEAPESCPVGPTSQGPSSSKIAAQEAEHHPNSSSCKLSGANADVRKELASSAEAPSLAATSESDAAAKLDFDLNEGIPGDDGNQGEPAVSAATVCSSEIHLPSLSSFPNPMSNSLHAPITVAAPAKGPFVPPENLLKSKGEPGWKGSAATSAFRPAEPRKVLEMPLNASDVSSSDAAVRQGRPPLDIDLNVPDERVIEDMASQSSAQPTGLESGIVSNRDATARTSGGLDLDLNRIDEGTENGQFLASTSRRQEVSLLPVRSSPGEFPNGEVNSLRDFDLNNGPSLDEVNSERASRNQHSKSSSSMPFLPAVGGLRVSNPDLGSVSTWYPPYPPGNSYPAVAIPSFLPDRGEQPYPIVAAPGPPRILGSVTGGGNFGSDIYRGPVLSSSPAMAFSPATAFPYAGFPFGASFPLASTSFSGGSTTYVDSSPGGQQHMLIPSQLVGPAGAVSSHYPRPYVISLPEGSTGVGSEGSRKWSRHGLDLNAGPGNADAEGKDERLPSASRPLMVATSQAFIDEQARVYGVPGGGLKRKEPEGGWDADRSAYKQLSWQ